MSSIFPFYDGQESWTNSECIDCKGATTILIENFIFFLILYLEKWIKCHHINMRIGLCPNKQWKINCLFIIWFIYDRFGGFYELLGIIRCKAFIPNAVGDNNWWWTWNEAKAEQCFCCYSTKNWKLDSQIILE